MKARSAKNKGRKFQNEVAARISTLIDIPWGQDELVASRNMGINGVDIILIGEAKKRFPWSVECKNDKSFNLRSWIQQAQENILPETDWVVFFKKNYFKPCACLDVQVFIDLFYDPTIPPAESSYYFYESKRWFLDKWIIEARSTGKTWFIELNERYVVFDMEAFFQKLTHSTTSVKGRIISNV